MRSDKNKKISACYIVKNEAERLALSLKNQRGVNEIIIVDTGSTDNTLDVAKNFGAKIFQTVWADDFSTPRNLALSQATGDWIIFLDADEYFTASTAENLRGVIEKIDGTEVNGLLVYLVNIDTADDDKILDTTFVLRIYRNLNGLAYVGKIHEELRLDGKNLPNVIPLPPKFLTLNHTGYSANLNKAKAERNLKLLLEELAQTDEPQRIYGYIAQCYNGLEDFVNAEKFAKLDIESGLRRSTFSSSSYRILLDILSRDSTRLEERKNFAMMAAEDFPDLPDFLAELAECYAAQKDFESAIILMTGALENFAKYDGIEPSIFDEQQVIVARQRIRFWTQKFAESLLPR